MKETGHSGYKTPDELAAIDFEKKRKYWTSIITIRDNTVAALAQGTRTLKSGRGYQAENIAPIPHEEEKIPLTAHQRARMKEACESLNNLLETHEYRRYLRMPRRHK